MSALTGLSRRERQIMDILYRRGKASGGAMLFRGSRGSLLRTWRAPAVRLVRFEPS